MTRLSPGRPRARSTPARPTALVPLTLALATSLLLPSCSAEEALSSGGPYCATITLHNRLVTDTLRTLRGTPSLDGAARRRVAASLADSWSILGAGAPAEIRSVATRAAATKTSALRDAGDLSDPARDPDVVAVLATDDADARAAFVDWPAANCGRSE